MSERSSSHLCIHIYIRRFTVSYELPQTKKYSYIKKNTIIFLSSFSEVKTLKMSYIYKIENRQSFALKFIVELRMFIGRSLLVCIYKTFAEMKQFLCGLSRGFIFTREFSQCLRCSQTLECDGPMYTWLPLILDSFCGLLS